MPVKAKNGTSAASALETPYSAVMPGMMKPSEAGFITSMTKAITRAAIKVKWAGLRRAAANGITVDLGRTAPEQGSLAEFKQRWGSEMTPLAYDYWPGIGGLASRRRDGGPMALATAVWSRLPRPVARWGSALYRYLG